MDQDSVDWDLLESKWSSLEKNLPEARRTAKTHQTTIGKKPASNTVGVKSKSKSKKLASAYSTLAASHNNDSIPSGNMRRKRPAFGTGSLGNESVRAKKNGDGELLLPDIGGGGRMGTPLRLADFDETSSPRTSKPQRRQRVSTPELSTPTGARNSRRDKKFQRASSSAAEETEENHSKKEEEEELERWDSSTLIEKKMMLPYLDKFLYIGTKIERLTADLAAETAKEQARELYESSLEEDTEFNGGGDTWRSSEGSPRSQHPETNSAQGSARSLPSPHHHRSINQNNQFTKDEDDNKGEDDNEMYFHRSDSMESGSQHRKKDRGVAREGVKRLKKASASSGKKSELALTVPVPSGGRMVAATRHSLSVDARVLSSRYVRFWEAANLSSAVFDPTQEPPRIRSVPWLLQLIEDIYDGAHSIEQSVTVIVPPPCPLVFPFRSSASSCAPCVLFVLLLLRKLFYFLKMNVTCFGRCFLKVDTGGKHVKKETIKSKQAREDLEKKFLHYDGQSVLRAHGKPNLEEEGIGPGECFASNAVGSGGFGGSQGGEIPPLPSFVVSFFERRHGVPDMVKKSCIELLLTLEEIRRLGDEARDVARKKAAYAAAVANAKNEGGGGIREEEGEDDDIEGGDGSSALMEPVLEAELFANFLRELYTADHLCFFLHARHVTQTLFGIKLSSLKSRVLSDGAAGVLEATANSRRVAGVGRDPMAAPNRDYSRATAAGSGGLFRRPGDLFLRPHPSTHNDGTLQPCLAPSALELVAKTLLSQGMAAGADVTSSGGMKGSAQDKTTATLAQRHAKESRLVSEFLVQVLLKRHGQVGALVNMEVQLPSDKATRFMKGDVASTRSFARNMIYTTNHKAALPVQNWLTTLVEVLRSAPDEVAREGKEGAEALGGKMLMIEKMQETIADGELVESLINTISQSEQEAAKCALDLQLDQRRFEVVSTQLSHNDDKGQNLLELAEEQGKLRSRIVLGKAEVGRTKAVVAELKKQKLATETRKEAIWAEIMGMEDDDGAAVASSSSSSSTKKKNRKRARVDLKADRLSATMSSRAKSSVRCFTIWSVRQGKRHEAAKEVAASMAIGGGWKKDLDQLKVKATLKIQRAYRDRMQKKRLAAARAMEAARQVVARKLAEKEAFEASLAVRASHAAAEERQIARSRTVLAARAQATQAALNRAALTKRGVADFEVERRWRRHQLRLKRHVYQSWAWERAVRIHAQFCFHNMIKRSLQEWHEEAAYNTKLNLSASKIQHMWMQRQARERTALLRLMMNDRDEKISMLLNRIRHRFEIHILNAWHEVAVQLKKARQMAERIWGNLRRETLFRMKKFVGISRQERHMSALKITSVLRGRALYLRGCKNFAQNMAASKIQNWIRSRLAYFEVIRMKQRLAQLNGQLAIILGDKNHNLSLQCFKAWYRGCIVEKRAMLAGRKVNHRLLRLAVVEWRSVVVKLRKRRAEDAAMKAEAALSIQVWIRGIWARRPFLEHLALVRAARVIQKGWRGRLARFILRMLLRRKQCAILIQAVFRGYQARKHQVGMRLADVLRAAENNDYDRLMWYMDTFGYEVAFETDKDGNTALHRAAIGGARRCLKLCLARGGDPNGYNSIGLTPLHCAIGSTSPSRDEVAAYLMDHGAYIESPDFEGNTPLLLAAKLGRGAICGQLLDREAELHIKDFEGQSPLHAATSRGQVGAVQALLDHGAAPDEAGVDGVTPLHEAVGRSDKDMVQCLLEEGALPDVQDDDGFTPLMYAATNDLAEMASALLSFGASVDGRDAEGRTGLHISAEKGSVGVVGELLLADADLLAADGDGDTALHVAVRAAAQREAESKLKTTEANGKASKANTAELAANATEFNVAKEARLVVAEGDARRTKAAALALQADRSTRYGGRAVAYVAPTALADTLNDVAVVEEALDELKPRDHAKFLLLSEERGYAMEKRARAVALREDADNAAQAAEEAGIAVQRSIQVIEKLLASGAHLSAQNEDGDQPAHLASRLGHVASMDLLIKYEAPMGRRNWAELTPIGVARMHGRLAVIQYLLDNLAPEALGIFEPDDDPETIEGPEPIPWDQPVLDQSEFWEEAWDTENQTTYYVNKKTGEMSSTAPRLSAETVIKLREFRKERAFKAKVHMEVGHSLVGTQEYREFVANEKAGAERLRLTKKSAIMVQRYWRRRAARIKVQQMRTQRDAARRIQRLIRSHQRHQREKIQIIHNKGAIGFQRLWRGMSDRKYYVEVLYDDLWWARHCRYFALLVQRLWAGYVFRRRVRRLKMIAVMGKKLRHEEWLRLISESKQAAVDETGPKAPLRSFRMYDEYRLKNTLDVNYYVHRLTSAGTWEQPNAWVDDDVRIRLELAEMLRLGYTVAERDAAIKFQRMWRMRVVRVAFKNVMKGQRLMRGGEVGYLQDPNSPVAVANFALFKHVIAHDYPHARLLYARCMEMMTSRGPDNCFVLLSYAIYLAVTQEDDWDSIELLAERGRKANYHNKRDLRADRYNLAKAGYYRLATVMSRRPGEAWHNYALCLFLAFKDYNGAQAAFIQAVLGSPGDEKVMDNFDYFLETCRPELLEEGYDAFELVRTHCVNQAKAKDEAKKARMKELDSVECHAAATTLQLHFRAAKLRTLFEGKKAKELSKKPVKEVEEGRLINDRAQLVEQGLAYWLWEQFQSEEGRPCWYNNETGESTWEPPDDEYDILAAHDVENNGLEVHEDGGGLPVDLEEWEVCGDEEGRTFYYNTRTGESQWEEPLMDEAEPLALTYGEDSTVQSQLASPVWEECFDNDGRVFYYNVESGESSWVDPRQNKPPSPAQSVETEPKLIEAAPPSPRHNEDDPLSEELQGVADGNEGVMATLETAGNWEAAEDDEGNVFYYNHDTGESTYERPDGVEAGDEQPPSPEHSEHGDGTSIDNDVAYDEYYLPVGDWEYVEDLEGGSYWYNNSTGESSWDKPGE